LVDILVAFGESLLGELGHFSFHHAVFVTEKTVRSSEEALKGDNLLEESELGVGSLLAALLLRLLDGLVDGGVDLGVNLGSGKGGKIG